MRCKPKPTIVFGVIPQTGAIISNRVSIPLHSNKLDHQEIQNDYCMRIADELDGICCRRRNPNFFSIDSSKKNANFQLNFQLQNT